jgi:hypothetical protein
MNIENIEIIALVIIQLFVWSIFAITYLVSKHLKKYKIDNFDEPLPQYTNNLQQPPNYDIINPPPCYIP